MAVWKSKIVWRNFFKLFIPAFILIVVVSEVFLYILSENEKEKIELRQRDFISIEEKSINLIFSHLIEDLNYLAVHNELKSYLADTSNAQNRLHLAKEMMKFAREKELYGQIRLLGTDGMELVRINNRYGRTSIIPFSHLQDKSGRYYYHHLKQLEENEIYISPLDLNIENGQIETPYRPVIRLSAPVINDSGQIAGYIIINYSAQKLLKLFREYSNIQPGNAYLLNNLGFYYVSPDTSMEWAYQHKQDSSIGFASDYPDEWPIIAKDSGHIQFSSKNGLFTASRIYPLNEAARQHRLKSQDENYYWHIVSHIPNSIFAQAKWDLRKNYFLVFLIALIAISIAIWMYAYTRDKEVMLNKDLVGKNIFLESLLDSFDYPIYVINIADYSLHHANFAALKRGVDVDKKCYSAIFGSDKPCQHVGKECPARIIQRNKEPVQFEFQSEDELGNERYYEFRAYPVFDQNNEVVQIVGYSIDVSARKKQERELVKLSQAVKQSASAIMITDTKGIIEYVNPKLCEMTGYSEEELTGKSPSILKSYEHSEEFYESMIKDIFSGKVWAGEIINKRKNGERYWELTSIGPIRNSEGQIINFIQVSEEISEMKKLESELRKANDFKDKMFQIISHDLRGLIGNYKSVTELLATTDITAMGDRLDRLLEGIREEAASTYNLLENLLYWARSQRGELQQNIEKIDVRDVVGDIAKLYNGAAINKEISLTDNLSELDGPLYARVDNNLIHTSLRNLVSNAIKFTPADGQIHITAQAVDDGFIRLSVSDTGVGISPELIEKIKDEQEVVSTFGTGNEKGSGLGLKLVVSFVREMGGRFDISSKDQQGSVFMFTVPRWKE